MTSQQEREVGNEAFMPTSQASIDRGAGLTRGVQLARIAFVVLAAAFAACVMIQVFLAGLSVFVSPLNWSRHTTFIHLFDYLPLLLLIFSFAGRLAGVLRWQSAALIGLVYAQYFTANVAVPLPLAAAAHPVIAMVIFWLAITVTARSWRVAARPQGVGTSAASR